MREGDARDGDTRDGDMRDGDRREGEGTIQLEPKEEFVVCMLADDVPDLWGMIVGGGGVICCGSECLGTKAVWANFHPSLFDAKSTEDVQVVFLGCTRRRVCSSCAVSQ